MQNGVSTLPTLRSGVLTVAAFKGFAPFAWEEDGEARGRDIAFLRRFAEQHGLGFRVRFHDFDRLWEAPERGEADIAASGISLMPGKREAQVAWSRPYSEVRRTLLTRKDDAIRGMTDLAGRSLSVVACSAAHDHAKQALPETANLRFCETLQEGIEDLLAGKTDAVGTGDVSARHHLTVREGMTAVDAHTGLPPEYITFAVRESDQLVRQLDTFIFENNSLY